MSLESSHFGTSFASCGKTLDGQDDKLPRHQKADQAHGDCVHEHGVKVIMDHALDGIGTL